MVSPLQYDFPMSSVCVQNATLTLGNQLVFDLPNDLMQYLQFNLPRGVNSVQSLPYPLYVILYLLSIAGYNINTIVPGLDIPSGLLPDSGLSDIPVFPPNTTDVLKGQSAHNRVTSFVKLDL